MGMGTCKSKEIPQPVPRNRRQERIARLRLRKKLKAEQRRPRIPTPITEERASELESVPADLRIAQRPSAVSLMKPKVSTKSTADANALSPASAAVSRAAE